MKKTKNMIYRPTEESRELFLYTVNDSGLYQITLAIIENLRKKAKKGIYDSDKAIDYYYMLSTKASEKYFKDFGYKFTVTDRYTAAVDFEKYYREDHVFYEL